MESESIEGTESHREGREGQSWQCEVKGARALEAGQEERLGPGKSNPN